MLSAVCRGKDIDDFNKGCFHALGWAESGLEGFVQVIELKVGMDFGSDNAMRNWRLELGR